MSPQDSGIDETTRSTRATARAHAASIRESRRKKDLRNRWIYRTGVVIIPAAIIAIVVLVLANVARSDDRGPRNMLSDGIKIGTELIAERTPALAAGSTPESPEGNPDAVIDIRIYLDYLCQGCGLFEQNNGEQLRRWIDSGAVTVEIHPIALLTSKSAGTQYSVRAANAAACVADSAPDSFYDFHSSLLTDQPAEDTPGLSDAELVERAADAGVTNVRTVESCIEDRRFRQWVHAATERALIGPLPDSSVEAVTGTPTILVNGEIFRYSPDFDPVDLAQLVLQAEALALVDELELDDAEEPDDPEE